MTPEILSQLTGSLYQAALRYRSAEFQEQALLQLKRVLPFDYAMWGLFAIVDKESVPHSVHLHNLPQEMLSDMSVAPHQDPLARKNLSQPGCTHAIALQELSPEHAEFRKILDKWDIGYALGTCIVQPISGLVQLIVLHRSQRGPAFTEAERQFKETLTPHFWESQRQSRQFQIRRELLRAWEKKHYTATVDRHGVLYDVEDRFLEKLAAEWPGWRGARLPKPLVELIVRQDDWHYRGQHINIHAGPMDDLQLMIASAPGLLTALTRREHEIARLYAQGMTYKAIAERLFISPATARTHLASIYRKLGVSNKAALSQQLARADGAFSIVDNHRG